VELGLALPGKSRFVFLLNGLSVIDDIDEYDHAVNRILEPGKNPNCCSNSICFINDGWKKRFQEGLRHFD
jgi:hypothetical protein